MSQRSRVEIARAVLRLATESLVPVADLSDELLAHPRSIVRWITEGKSGVHLDGFHKPGVGWMTSRAAVKRFDAALSASRKTAPQTDRPTT